ncbi:MAG: hypothetical protein AAFQ37_03985 [Bacteroidota bacterium]
MNRPEKDWLKIGDRLANYQPTTEKSLDFIHFQQLLKKGLGNKVLLSSPKDRTNKS